MDYGTVLSSISERIYLNNLSMEVWIETMRRKIRSFSSPRILYYIIKVFFMLWQYVPQVPNLCSLATRKKLWKQFCLAINQKSATLVKH